MTVPGEPSRDITKAPDEIWAWNVWQDPMLTQFWLTKDDDVTQCVRYLRADLVSARIATLEADLKAERDACVIIHDFMRKADVENESLRSQLSRDSARRKELAEILKKSVCPEPTCSFCKQRADLLSYLRETP